MSRTTSRGLPVLALLLGAGAGWWSGEAPPEAPSMPPAPPAASPEQPAQDDAATGGGGERAGDARAPAGPGSGSAPDAALPAPPSRRAPGWLAEAGGRVWRMDLDPAQREAWIARSTAYEQAEAEAALADAAEEAARRAVALLREERSVRTELLAGLARGDDRAVSRLLAPLPLELLADTGLSSPLRADLSALPIERRAPGRDKREVPPGTLLQLDEGVYDGATRLRAAEGAEGLFVRGAGRDRTVLVLEGDSTSRLGTLVLQDLTVVLAGDRGLEARRTLRLEAARCRFVLGTSAPLLAAADGALVLLDECLVEGGFGAGRGTDKRALLHGRRWLLGRLHDCAFTGPLPLLVANGVRRALVLDRVQGLGALAGGLPPPGGAADGLLLLDTPLPERPDPRPERPVARRLADLNASWAALDR